MAERSVTFNAGTEIPFPVAASTSIELGKMVAINGSGYLIEAEDTAGLKVVGYATESVDNSAGANGAKSCIVGLNRAIWLDNSSTAIGVTGVGEPCYVEDDETVTTAAGATHEVRAGIVLQLDSTLGVLVYFDGLNDLSASTLTLGSLAVTGNASVGGTLTQTGIATFTASPVLSAGADVAAGQSITGAGALTIESDAAATLTLDGQDITVTPIATFAASPVLSAGADVAAGQSITGAGELTVVSAAGSDLNLEVAPGAGDILLKTGDAVGAQKVSIVDSANVEVASIDSDGLGTFVGLLATGTATVPYAETTTGGPPTQLEIATAFGAAADGKVGVYWDDTPGVAYLCAASATGTWYYVAMTVGAP